MPISANKENSTKCWLTVFDFCIQNGMECTTTGIESVIGFMSDLIEYKESHSKQDFGIPETNANFEQKVKDEMERNFGYGVNSAIIFEPEYLKIIISDTINATVNVLKSDDSEIPQTNESGEILNEQ